MQKLWLQMRVLYDPLQNYRSNPTRLNLQTVGTLLGR